MVNIALIGSGWRSEFYLRITSLLCNTFKICGVVSRSEEKRQELSHKWNVKTYKNVEDLLEKEKPDFFVIAVNKDICTTVIIDTLQYNIPILAETPPANSLDLLIELNEKAGKNARIQIAEQYAHQPSIAARIKIADVGIIGKISHVQVSIGHGYHGVSLIRRILGVSYEKARIKATIFSGSVIDGPSRNGWSQEEQIVKKEQLVATLDFNGKTAVFDFEKDQHRSPLRSSRLLIRGDHGEICDMSVKYMDSYKMPLQLDIKRHNQGENEDPQSHSLRSITAGAEYYYVNKFNPLSLSDEEIAIATVLDNMYNYVMTGKEFYSLAEASQDCYLAIMIERSARENVFITTELMQWAKNE